MPPNGRADKVTRFPRFGECPSTRTSSISTARSPTASPRSRRPSITCGDLRDYPPLALAEVKCHVGLGAENLLEQTVPGTDIAVDSGRGAPGSIIRRSCSTMTWLLPGAMETLTTLRAGGGRWPCAATSRGSSPVKLLVRLDIAECFDAVLGPEDVPHPKPGARHAAGGDAAAGVGGEPGAVHRRHDRRHPDGAGRRRDGVDGADRIRHGRGGAIAARPDRLLHELRAKCSIRSRKLPACELLLRRDIRESAAIRREIRKLTSWRLVAT